MVSMLNASGGGVLVFILYILWWVLVAATLVLGGLVFGKILAKKKAEKAAADTVAGEENAGTPLPAGADEDIPAEKDDPPPQLSPAKRAAAESVLRQPELADAPLLLAWLQDKETNRWLDGDMDTLTLQDMTDFICGSLIAAEKEDRVITDGSGAFRGLISLKHIDSGRARAELGLGLTKEAQGQGLACAAADELLYYAFSELGLELVYGCVRQENGPALAFCRRFGLNELAAPPEGAPAPAEADKVIWVGLTAAEFWQRWAKE
ncbi:MAG: GNAT family N-acetyltransferase [Firmicutes bacterium]|nr:GNAT family N-acetyltransferase [Bacillota bacterium]